CLCDDYCDWVEIRDGPTEHAPLIGRYCSVYAPSTIFSTGNFLFFRIHTDSSAASAGFTAVYELASCGGTVVLRPGINYTLTSPNYPDVYPLRTECDWLVRAPNSHMVDARVVHMGLTWNVNCSTDSLAIRDGNKTAPYLLEPQCNGRYLTKVDYRSASSSMTVQFRSNGTIQKAGRQLCKDKKCGFELTLRVSNESCGGIITDQEGQLTTPGYPGRLLPHFVNGKPKHEAINFRNDHTFCDYRKTFVSDADLVTVRYSDEFINHYNVLMDDFRSDAFYVPFRVNYTKVTVILFFVVRLATQQPTVDVPRVVNERFCKASFMNSTKPITRLYLNQDLEMHVFSMQSAFLPEEGLSFKLNVKYYSESTKLVSYFLNNRRCILRMWRSDQ
ncbi:CUB domain protein, partial [Ancylostoma ceylanicum]